MSSLSIIEEQKEGVIPHCPYQNCGFTCCQFNQNNFIALYPGEVEEAIKQKKSLGHLELTPYHGGYKAVCKAKDTSCCDGGYKPLDCQSYPFFPTSTEKTILINLKGKKCPLTHIHLKVHRFWVKKQWDKLSHKIPELHEWLKKVELVGYEQYKDDTH